MPFLVESFSVEREDKNIDNYHESWELLEGTKLTLIWDQRLHLLKWS